MASIFNKNENPPMINSIFSPKNLLISITSALVALMLKLYAPLIFELLLSGVPMIWTTLGSWFTPPYLYVIVNFIIIAIAASSRFQQQNNTTTDDGNKAREVVAPIKAQAQAHEYPYAFDVVTKNNSGEHKVELEVKTIKKPRALEVKARKNLEAENIDQIKIAAAGGGVGTKSRLLVDLETKDILDQVKTKKKPPAVVSKPTESVYTETKKKVMESLQEFEVRRQNKKDGGDMEERWLQVRNKMESSAKEGEDHHARSKSVGMSYPINSTQNNQSPYFFSQEKGLLTSDYQENHQHTLQAGKDESSTEVEEGEENDTLDGTWKMIMERSRIQNGGPHEQASLGFEKFKESSSPSQSTRMQDTSNW